MQTSIQSNKTIAIELHEVQQFVSKCAVISNVGTRISRACAKAKGGQ